jgi:hypothetical protein
MVEVQRAKHGSQLQEDEGGGRSTSERAARGGGGEEGRSDREHPVPGGLSACLSKQHANGRGETRRVYVQVAGTCHVLRVCCC